MNCRNLTRSLITLAWLVLMAGRLSASDPRLAVTYNGGNLVLRWPLAEGSWVLDQSPGLKPPISWTRVPPALYQIAGTNMAFVAFPRMVMAGQEGLPHSPATYDPSACRMMARTQTGPDTPG